MSEATKARGLPALDGGRTIREQLVAASHDAMVCADARGVIVMWNDGARRVFGHSADEALGRSLDVIVPEAMRGEHAAGMRRLVGGGAPRLIGKAVEIPAQHADGRLFPIEMRLSVWGEGSDRTFGAVIRDVSERRHAEDRLHSLAHFDQLTMLPNRNLFLQRLTAAIGDGPATVILFDLDQFGALNDQHGHSAADEALRQTALRLRRAVLDGHAGSDDKPTVARLAGDDFGVLLPGVGDAISAAQAADRIREAMSEPLTLGERTAALTGSMGVALAPQHGRSAGKLLANADFALRRSRADGGDARRIFEPADRDAVIARRTLEAELRDAWAFGAFEVFYQPQVRLCDRRVTGAEALLRWRHPVRGLLQPQHFIRVLEDSPLSEAVGDWVLFDACRRAKAWRDLAGDGFRVGVNLFEAQFSRRDAAGPVQAALDAAGLPPDGLELEITENVATASDEESIRRVRRLRDLGVRIAFDDYGTGYASLSLLKRYAITRLKIDRSFVRRLPDDADDATIVELVLTLGQRFGLDVTAEGIETVEQEAYLRRLGCTEGQGFLYGRPMEAEAFTKVLLADIAGVHAARFSSRRSFDWGRRTG